MKYIKLFILIASVSLFAACSDDSLDSKSIFDTQNKEEQNDFDKWLKTNVSGSAFIPCIIQKKQKQLIKLMLLLLFPSVRK